MFFSAFTDTMPLCWYWLPYEFVDNPGMHAWSDNALMLPYFVCLFVRYVDRLSSNLQRKAGQEAKMLAAAAETQARQQESRAMLAGLQPKVCATNANQ